jgi:hypothetical protein
MKHPNREEWIPLLCGEADAETKQRLEGHLRECADCATEVSAWRRTLGRLDTWKLPTARTTHYAPRPALAWAAAAAIVAAAFFLGRFSSPRVDAEQLRAELKSELNAQLQEGFARASMETSAAFANFEARLAAAANRENKQLAAQFADLMDEMRSDDRRDTQALFEKLQEQYAGDFMLLRKDLETVASFTDDEIRSARLKLIEIAANQTAAQP